MFSFLLDQKRNKKVKNERQLQVLVCPHANSFIALKLAVRTVRPHPAAQERLGKKRR
jgi:hypothetical protein